MIMDDLHMNQSKRDTRSLYTLYFYTPRRLDSLQI